MWLNDERPRNGGLIPVPVMVAGDKVHLLAPDSSSEVSGISGRHFERVVAKDVQLVFGLDLFIDIGDKRIVHCIDAAKRPVREFEDALVSKMGVRGEPNHSVSVSMIFRENGDALSGSDMPKTVQESISDTVKCQVKTW